MSGSDPLAAGVVLAVEQLRRQVPGGVGTYARGLLLGLSRLGGQAPPYRLYASRAPRGDDPVGRLGAPLRTSALPGRALVEAWSLGLCGVGAGPALTHSVSLSAPPSRPPLVVTVHDLAWREVPGAFPGRGRRWHEAALARARRRAAAFVVPSPAAAEALAAAGVSEQAVRVIPEAADHLPAPDLEGARRLLDGLGAGGQFLLSVGTLEPRKNLARLVAAYGLVRRRLPEPWPLVLVGPSGWGEALGRDALSEGVLLAGRVPDAVLAGCYALCRLFAYVPLLEGFGLPVIEAMAAGAPVVASAVPALDGADAALRVDPSDVEAIADALLRGAGDDELRARLVAAGEARAGELSWESTARLHVELWREIAISGPAGGAASLRR